MTLSVCPMTTIHAPIERVWPLLSEPANFDRWWDAQTLSISPEGHARPGQTIHARTRGFGRWWNWLATVEAVDDAAHQLDLTTRLPLGISVRNHITCAALDSADAQVSFG